MKYKLKITLPSISLELDDADDNANLFSFLNNFFEFIENKQEYLFSSNKSTLNEKYNVLLNKIGIGENNETSILITDSSEILINIKKLANKLFNFTPEGDVIYKISKENLTNAESIFLVSLEKRLLFEENLIERPNINAETISKRLSLEKNQANARLSDLVKANILKRVERGEYKLNLYSINDIMNNIIDKTLKT